MLGRLRRVFTLGRAIGKVSYLFPYGIYKKNYLRTITVKGHGMGYANIEADVARAIERQDYEGGRGSICDFLQAVGLSDSDYWRGVACELHRNEKFYDSLDCWREGEKYFSNNKDEVRYFYLDMIRTLINATDQTGEEYFKQQAANACERLVCIDVSEESLNFKLELIDQTVERKNEILFLVEQIFDNSFDLTVTVNPYRLGIPKVESIESYIELAECYLWSNEIADAFRIWTKVMKEAGNQTNEHLCSAIYMLNWYASENFELEKFLPSELE